VDTQKPPPRDFRILPQPNDAACGPTCLEAIYRHFDDAVDLDRLLEEVATLEDGGTLAVNLANHALVRGYSAVIYTYNLVVFDPTWFHGKQELLPDLLRAQARVKDDPKLAMATASYLEFLELGGELAMEDLSVGLLRHWLERRVPVLTGLSATFLYKCARERGKTRLHDDDVAGSPTGHFVVLCGWDAEERKVQIADPFTRRPLFQDHVYWLPVERVINAILLGVLTYDANLLVLRPRSALP
jgi:hypothetical protein